jgi:hypothetical protein
MAAYIPVALVCVINISNAVPVGAQMAWLSSKSKGCPLEVSRVAAVIHFAVAQGPLPAVGGGRVQPTTP